MSSVTYASDPYNGEEIKAFIGGVWPACPHCQGHGEYETEFGPKGCNHCASRLLPIQTDKGVEWIDYGDTVIRTDDGAFSILSRGEELT